MTNATFYWTLSYSGSNAGETIVGGHGGANESGANADGTLRRIDFLSIDTGERIGGTGSPIDYFNYPIRAGNYSYERFVRFYFAFGSDTNKITGMKLWLSQGDNDITHTWISGGVTTSFTGPVQTGSSKVTTIMPTGETSALNVDTALTASGYSKYAVLQLGTASSAPPGDVQLNGGNALQFTAQYDEQ